MTEQPDPAAPRDDPSATGHPMDQAADQHGQPVTETIAYSPPPESHPDWMRSGWLDPAEPAGPAPAPTEPVAPASPAVKRGAPDGLGRILGAAVLSAILASGGTVVVLESTGALNRPAAGSPGQQVGQTSHPVTIDDSSAVVAAAASVSPAVVRITATGTINDQFGGQIPERGVGSGVIYDQAGWILTNRHVVQTEDGSIASQLTVELKDGREFSGTVYGVDTLTDLAIVKVDQTGLPAAPTGKSADIKVGQLAIAIGSPLGTYTSTVTTGIISATGRSIDLSATSHLTNLIQTDAAINPGNSGGPLLDAAGQVIGINTAVERDSTGIGFAIPIDIARPIMEQALAGEQLARPYVGIRYIQIDLKVKKDKNLSVDHGALIEPTTDTTGTTLPAITPGSPAEKAGLKAGDIVLEIEGTTVDSEHPLDAQLTSYAPGQSVRLTILRDGKQIDVSVTLGTRPEGL
ncbi:MAG TPA: trypsin-like peptidase domain-containing protein [Patescibacteria group bacterium]|jgi:S1-C subfamily serine protease|nr:trypsin-like peptidase domain-containing protein [Patescibacteria group bacterium]